MKLNNLFGRIRTAEHSIEELYQNAEAGYGKGDVIGIIADVLKNSIPEDVIKFLPDAINKADGQYK